jgi:hypothetical protein
VPCFDLLFTQYAVNKRGIVAEKNEPEQGLCVFLHGASGKTCTEAADQFSSNSSSDAAKRKIIRGFFEFLQKF